MPSVWNTALTVGMACDHTLTAATSRKNPGRTRRGRTNGVMQTKRLIPLSPQVSDACFALANQRLYSEILESRRQFEPRLATPDDDHDGLLVGPLARDLPTPLLRPRPELGFPLPPRTDKLREAVQALEAGEDRVRLPIPAARQNQAEDAGPDPRRRREREERLDPRDVRVGLSQDRGVCVELEVGELGCG